MKNLFLIALAAFLAVSCDLLFNRDSDSTPPTNDIAVTAINSSPSATIGEIISLGVTVKNPGSLDVEDAIEIALIDRTQGEMIGTQTIENGLGRSDSVTLNYSWDTREAVAGEHTIVAAHNIADDNVANDSLMSVLSIVDPNVTDLAILSVKAPTMINEGDTLDVEIVLKNIGNQDVSEPIEVFLKDNTSTEDIDMLTLDGGLASGDSEVLLLKWNTEGTSLGIHEIEAGHMFSDENSGNDAIVQEITVTEAPFADVAITELDAPASATEGDVVTVSATVRNLGTLDASETFSVTLFDETENIQLASQSINGGLALGNTVVISFNWDTEGVSIGGHDLTVSHTFNDLNESNDSRSAQLVINEVPVTDIAITQLNGTSPVNQGDNVTLSVEVENQGNQDVDQDIVVTITDETDGTTVGSATINNGLSPGESTSLNIGWDTDDSSIGNHRLVAGHNISDDDDSNDSRSRTIFVDEPPFIDLAVVAVNGPSSATQGDNVTVSIRLDNLGNRDIDSDINVTLYDDEDNITIGTKSINGVIEEGKSAIVSFIWDTDESSIGDHSLVASHDLDDDRGSNDSRSKTITINEPIFLDIAITDVNVATPTPVRVGDIVTLEITLQNQGNRDVNQDITVRIFDQTDGTEIGTGTKTISGGLEQGSSSTLSINWNTSGVSVANHLLEISHNYSDDDESNNTATVNILVEDP